jgi:hypothetical protein
VQQAAQPIIDPAADRAAAVAAELDAAGRDAAALPYEGDVAPTPMILVVAFFAAFIVLIVLGAGVATGALLSSGGCGGP